MYALGSRYILSHALAASTSQVIVALLLAGSTTVSKHHIGVRVMIAAPSIMGNLSDVYVARHMCIVTFAVGSRDWVVGCVVR